MDYKKKITTIDTALQQINDGDQIVVGLAAAEPIELLKSIHKIAARINKVTITNCISMLSEAPYMQPQYRDKFAINTWFYTDVLRKEHEHGNISFIPNHLHMAAAKRLFFAPPDIYAGNATYPDKHGYLSLSLSNVYEKQMFRRAKTTILEMNSNLPRTLGDVEVHIDDVDYLIETDYPIVEFPQRPPNERDTKIGAHIAALINDGDTIQLGIGGIPDAVAAALTHKKDLGVHTEMLTTGLMRLAKSGVVTGKRKNFYPGKIIAAFALGSRELYDFIDDNPAVQILDGKWVNDPAVIGRNDNQVSINTTLEIDLVGQCASESIGARQFSGSGGQVDTAVGAQNSRGGRSFIALYSTADIRQTDGSRRHISKIVPTLKPGAIVTLSRNDVDFVVTEYGVASLRGTDVQTRCRRLIAIAHPEFRDQLTEQAILLGFLPTE